MDDVMHLQFSRMVTAEMHQGEPTHNFSLVFVLPLHAHIYHNG